MLLVVVVFLCCCCCCCSPSSSCSSCHCSCLPGCHRRDHFCLWLMLLLITLLGRILRCCRLCMALWHNFGIALARRFSSNLLSLAFCGILNRRLHQNPFCEFHGDILALGLVLSQSSSSLSQLYLKCKQPFVLNMVWKSVM